MLEILKEKVVQEGLGTRIRFHKAGPQSLALEYPGRIDVAFGFCVVHEVPDPGRLMQEVFSLLVPGGTFLIAEPKHEIPADEFDKTLFNGSIGRIPQDWHPIRFAEQDGAVQKGWGWYPR